MIRVDCGEYGPDGIADLSEAIEVARTKGIANAKNAINPELLWNCYSVGNAVAIGMGDMIPGVIPVLRHGTLDTDAIDVARTAEPVRVLAKKTEEAIQRAAGHLLPEWEPTSKFPGVRFATMRGEARFPYHTDDYEGLVASVQMMVDGEKQMATIIDGQKVVERVEQGDITLFAGDTFSDQSRRKHGFRFSGGIGAVALIIGQDPAYTISGNYPFVEEHPEYFVSGAAEILRSGGTMANVSLGK